MSNSASNVDVSWLQESLNALGTSPQLVVDGISGPATRRAVLWFQGLSGLKADGVVDAATEAKVRTNLASRNPTQSVTKIRGVCIHGLGNEAFSEGMDALASELNTIPGVHFTVENQGVLFYENLPAISAALESAAQAGAMIVPIGHSMGADEVWKFAALAQTQRIRIPLAISIDPTFWGSPNARWPVPANVDRALNFWQPAPPGGGRLVLGPGSHAVIFEEQRPEPHIQIDNAPPVHERIVAEVRALVSANAPAPLAPTETEESNKSADILSGILAAVIGMRSPPRLPVVTTISKPKVPAPVPPILSPIDKFLGGEALVGRKTPLAIIAYAILALLQATGQDGTGTGMEATSTTFQVLSTLIAAFGGLGVLAKLDRAVQAIGMIATKTADQ